MPTAKKTPAKKTATKTATKKPAAKSTTAKKATAPTTKPVVSAKSFKPVPFNAPSGDTATTVAPNGQTVNKTAMVMLQGALRLENNGRKGNNGETAVSVAQRLLKSKKKGEDLLHELSMFIIKSIAS